MSKSMAKRILTKFLKEQKIYANISIFFYGKKCRCNNDTLNKYAKLADTSKTCNERKTYLIRMLGHTASYCEIVKPLEDHLFKAYQLWADYINTHIKEINEIYENEQSTQS